MGGAQVRREVSEGGGDRADIWGPQEGERTRRGLRAWPGPGACWLLPARPPASSAPHEMPGWRGAGLGGGGGGGGGHPGSEGSWGEAQVFPTCIPLGLGISGRRALLRGRPRPLAHFSAGAAGRRREGNSSGNHSPEPWRPRKSEHRAETKEPVLRKSRSGTLQVSL